MKLFFLNSYNPFLNTNRQQYSRSVSFGKFELNEEETAETVALLDKYVKTNDDDIFTEIHNYLKPHFDKHATDIAKFSYDKDDIFIKIIIEFYNKLNELKTKLAPQELLKSIIESINSIKPDKQDKITSKNSISLNTPIYTRSKNGKELIIGDTITESDLPKPLSTKSDKEMAEIKKKYEDTIKNIPDLSPKELEILRLRGEEKVYRAIGENLGIALTTARRKYLSLIAKIQQANNVLPEDFDIIASEYIEELNLKTSPEEMKEILIKFPELLVENTTKIKERISKMPELFGGLLNEDEYKEACLKQPSLFYRSSETIAKNVKDVAKIFQNEDLTLKDYLPACLKQPQLFYQKPETIAKNVKDVAKIFENEGLTLKEYLHACLKQSQLFYQNPETIAKNVKDVVKIFKNEGLTLKDYLPACLKQPTLFTFKAETTAKNVKYVAKIFKNEGLTLKDYLPACLKRPQLFAQKPETIEKNVKDVAKIFKNEGLTLKDYLPACLKQSQLFYQNPETIAKNVKDVAKIFKNEGLTLKEYLPTCLKQPSLFTQKPETIAKNVKDVAKIFQDEGLTLKEYLPTCLKQPSLFTQKPETITEHINAYLYIAENSTNNAKLNDIIQHKNLTYSTSKIYINGIIMPKLKEIIDFRTIAGKNNKEILINYFKENPDKTYTISIIKNEHTNNFIEVMDKFFADNGIKNPLNYKFIA